MKKPAQETYILEWAEQGATAYISEGKQDTGYSEGPTGQGEAPFYQHFNRKFQNLFRRAKESLLHQSQRDEIWGTQAQVQSRNDRATLYWDGADFRNSEAAVVALTGKKRILVRDIGAMSANLDLSALEVDLEMDGLDATLDLNGKTLTLGACSGELRVKDISATPGKIQIQGRANAIKILTDGNVTIEEVDGLFSGSYHLNGVLNSDRTQDLESRLSYVESTNWPYRNRIINGDCRIKQRGQVTHADGSWHYGEVDRFCVLQNFTNYNVVVSLEANAPGGPDIGMHAMRFRPGNDDFVSTGGARQVLIEQRIESVNIEDLSNQAATFSCLVRHGFTSSKVVRIQLSTPDTKDNYNGSSTQIAVSSDFTIESATTTPITFTCNDLGDVSKGLCVTLVFEAAEDLIYMSQVIETTNWQLEAGSKATSFEFRPFTHELQLCQRYFCKTFEQHVAPGYNLGMAGSLMFNGYHNQNPSGKVQPFVNWDFPVPMAKSPSFTFYATASGSGGNWCTIDNTDTGIAASAHVVSTRCVLVDTNNNPLNENCFGVHMTAEAEL